MFYVYYSHTIHILFTIHVFFTNGHHVQNVHVRLITFAQDARDAVLVLVYVDEEVRERKRRLISMAALQQFDETSLSPLQTSDIESHRNTGSWLTVFLEIQIKIIQHVQGFRSVWITASDFPGIPSWWDRNDCFQSFNLFQSVSICFNICQMSILAVCNRRIIEDWGLDDTWTVTVRYRLSGDQAWQFHDLQTSTILQLVSIRHMKMTWKGIVAV